MKVTVKIKIKEIQKNQGKHVFYDSVRGRKGGCVWKGRD